jgi:hypothetical protein
MKEIDRYRLATKRNQLIDGVGHHRDATDWQERFGDEGRQWTQSATMTSRQYQGAQTLLLQGKTMSGGASGFCSR